MIFTKKESFFENRVVVSGTAIQTMTHRDDLDIRMFSLCPWKTISHVVNRSRLVDEQEIDCRMLTDVVLFLRIEGTERAKD